MSARVAQGIQVGSIFRLHLFCRTAQQATEWIVITNFSQLMRTP